MDEQKPKRNVGRVDKIDIRRDDKFTGFIVTEDWNSYFFHSDDVEGRSPELYSIVSFEIQPPAKEGQQPRAVRVEVVKDKASPEFFGRFARFIRERNEEVA